MSTSSAQTVLVLAPHPDDESLGCGGTLRRIARAGGRVDVLYLTRGERGVEAGLPTTARAQDALAERRTAEALEACRRLGVQNVAFLPGRDGHLDTQPELAEEIQRRLFQDDYHSVFCPWPGESHTDHVATYRLLHRALEHYEQEISVWLYEVWTPLIPNLVLPIDDTIEDKLAALDAHQSQLALCDYSGAFRALARYRSLFCAPAQYAEAFFTCDRSSLLEDTDLPWLQQHGVPAATT